MLLELPCYPTSLLHSTSYLLPWVFLLLLQSGNCHAIVNPLTGPAAARQTHAFAPSGGSISPLTQAPTPQYAVCSQSTLYQSPLRPTLSSVLPSRTGTYAPAAERGAKNAAGLKLL